MMLPSLRPYSPISTSPGIICAMGATRIVDAVDTHKKASKPVLLMLNDRKS